MLSLPIHHGDGATAGGAPAGDRVADPVGDVVSGLVARAAALTWPSLPDDVRARTARVFADTVGAMLGGGTLPEVRALADQDRQAGPACLVTPDRRGATPTRAALVNGTAAVALELDGCSEGNGGHVAAHVVPAALAVAQSCRSSGAELLTAVVAGYEVAARLGQAHVWAPAVHGHGHVGTVGAAVAVAMLRGSDPVAAATVAGTLPLATAQQACLDGATARDAWAGLGASIGVLSEELARAGFTGSTAARDVVLGEVLGRRVDPARFTTPLEPGTLAVMRHSVKLHAACFETHTALEAALAHGVQQPGDVLAVDVEMAEPCLAELPNGSQLSRQFSVPYGVAAALVHGRTDPSAFAADETVLALARRVRVVPAREPMTRVGADDAPARVTVYRRDGSAVTHRNDLPRGHFPDFPADDVLAAKFTSLVPGRAARTEFARLLDVAALDDVWHLLDPLDGTA